MEYEEGQTKNKSNEKSYLLNFYLKNVFLIILDFIYYYIYYHFCQDIEG